MSSIPPVREFMTAHPYTIQFEETASAAEKVMNAHRIHHLPVIDGKKIMGLISDRELMAARGAYKGRSFDGQVLIKDICLFDPLTVRADESIAVVAKTMASRRQEAAIVMEKGEAIGIFTTSDACRLLAEVYKPGSTKRGPFAWFFDLFQ